MSNPGFTHLCSYLVSGLLPESDYKCLVHVRKGLAGAMPVASLQSTQYKIQTVSLIQNLREF